ncbi:MAG: hypothetical protein I8H71_00835 [Xanthomonadaceae bacterium]|nr:hypothetical protein [Xanthomonadaceae bacterium]
MRIVTVAAISAALIFGAQAQPAVDPALQAGLLSENCLLQLRGIGNVNLQYDCAARIHAYIGGWTNGVERGMIYFAISQPPTAGLKGDALTEAIFKMHASAQCLSSIGPKLTPFIRGFVDFVAAKPSRAAESYTKVLDEFVLAQYCNR